MSDSIYARGNNMPGTNAGNNMPGTNASAPILLLDSDDDDDLGRAVSDNAASSSSASSGSCNGDDRRGGAGTSRRVEKQQSNDDDAKELDIQEGFRICKQFSETNLYYTGKVISVEEAHQMNKQFNAPAQPFVRSSDNGLEELCWCVRYDYDGQLEEMSEGDLWAFAIPTKSQQPTVSSDPPACRLPEEQNNNETTTNRQGKRKEAPTSCNELSCNFVTPRAKQSPLAPREPGAKYQYDEALQHLLHMPLYEEDIKQALQETEPPYDLNKVVHRIRTKNQDNVEQSPEFEELSPWAPPFVNMRVRKSFDNVMHGGVVTRVRTLNSEQLWHVKYDDGDEEEYNYDEIYNIRAHRPIRSKIGRRFCALELFCGCAIVSKEFWKLNWRVASVDIDGKSNATDLVDIMKMQFSNIDFVPDFIWCSPPCFTYSKLAGGTHRTPSTGEYAKTAEAIEHDALFTRMVGILKFFKKKNSKLIVAIENPCGQLDKMPLMQQTEDYFPLHKAQVDYCAFERDDKKPTHIWTNNKRLCNYLNQFRCSRRNCPFYQTNHPDSARGRSPDKNYAAIPKLLAAEIAGWVHKEKRFDDGSWTEKEIIMSEADIKEFNELGDPPTDAAEI